MRSDEALSVSVTADCDQFYSSGEFGKAVECYTRAIENCKDNSDLARLYNNRGHAKYMMVDFYSARDDYDIAVKIDPKLDIAFYNRATINYRMGDFKIALEDFNIATSISPDNLEFREGLHRCQECLMKTK